MNIPKTTNVVATYNNSTVSNSQARPGAVAATPQGGSSTTPGNEAATAGTKEAARSRFDTLELSSQGLRLSLTQGAETPPPEEPPAPPPVSEAAEESELPPLLGAKESTWQSERKSKLDRLETLVRQGQYKVDPFILDELAVRMARLMN